MSYGGRRRYRHRSCGSLGSVVNDSAHIAVRFGPVGAMATGIVGFTLFHAVLPMLFTAWAEGNKAKLASPAATTLAKLIDSVMLHRFINPSEWAGIAILIVCSGIALWKLLRDDETSFHEIEAASWLAKSAAKHLQ